MVTEKATNAYSQVFGADWESKKVDPAKLANESAKRTPGFNLNEGDVVEFFEDFNVFEVTSIINKQSVTYKVTVVLVNDRPTQMPMSFLTNDFEGISAPTAEECGKLIAKRAAGEDVPQKQISNLGDILDKWRSCATMSEGISKIGGLKATVHVEDYVAGVFDSKPRKRYKLTKITTV